MMIWNWNESRDGSYLESFIKKIQDVGLVIAKNFKYLGVWTSYNKFGIGDKGNKHVTRRENNGDVSH